MTHPPRVVSSRVSCLITIVLSLTGALAHATTCDVDADGDIDRKDYLAILADIGKRASGPNDPRDADRNGRILSNDAQLCARRCTLALCDIPPNDIPTNDIPINKTPIAKNDAATTALDTRVRINVIANDRDRDGRIVPRTVRIVTKPKHGKVTRHRDGTVTYSPALGFRGRDRFRYRVKDNDGATSNAARVRITVVESGNGLPIAAAGPDLNVATGALVTLDGSNSSDPDGDPLTFSWQFLSVPPVSTVTNASLANRATAAPSFTTDVKGLYRLAIEVSDGQMTDVDTVRVTAATANVPPNADAGPDQSAVIGQIVDLDGQASSDPDAGPSPFAFRWFFVAVPPDSTLTDANITGAATAFASFAPDVAGAFRVGLEVDDVADTDQDEVVVTVSPPNVAPNANAGTDIVVQLGNQATLDGTASNDPDNGPSPLSFLWTFVSVPDDSVLTNANLSGATTATPSFTPDVAGQYLLRLDVTDGDLPDMDQVQVKANVAPNAADDSYTLVENTTLTELAPGGVLGNDMDVNSDPLTAAVVTDVANGTLALNADGSFTYTPATDFEGTDGFTYHANDGTADSNTATVSITVTHANESPVAVDDAFTTSEDTPLVVAIAAGVLGNDSDFEGDPLTAVVDTPPANGTLMLNADGSFTYTPNPDFNGTDSFSYYANDGTSDSNIATVNITVDAVNDVPSFTVGPDQTVLEGAGAQTVSGWATGISVGPVNELGQAIVGFNITGNTNPSLFSAGPAVSSSGDLTYEPAANASGIATITLTLADDGGTANSGADTSAPQSFTITVNDINGAPSFTKGADQSVNEDAGPQTVSPWATAIDDGDPGVTQTLTFNVTNNTNSGLFSAGPSIDPTTGTLTYSPAANQNGSATITLTLSDNGSNVAPNVNTSAAQSFVINVTAVNDAPSFTKGADQTVNEDSVAQSVPGWATVISEGPSDEAGQTLTFNVTNTNSGLFSAGPSIDPTTGTLTYTPAANANGSATITLTLSDNGSNVAPNVNTSAAQTFVINVTAVNDAPSFTKGADQTVNEDSVAQSVPGWATVISKGPSDEAGQTLTFNVTNNTNSGLFSAGPSIDPTTGTLTYTPAANQNGSATITLTLSDSGSNVAPNVNTSVAQTFTITVNAVNDAPVAQAKSYTAHTHMKIVGLSGLLSGVTDADSGVNGCTPTFTVANVNSADGIVSNVSAAAGTFDFDPNPGFTGPATASYTVQDTGCPGTATSAAATISITVSGPVIWFVQQGASGTNDGRLSNPFTSLGSVPAADSANDRVFVFTGTYTDGLALLSGEQLIGQGVTGISFDNFFGIAPPAGTIARPAINGTRPALQNTVTLNTNGIVRGLNITTTNNTALTDAAGATTGVTVNEVDVSATTATAVSFNDLGGTVNLGSTTSTGGTNNVSLTTVAATVNLGSGALSGATGTAFNVDGGIGAITYSGTITKANSAQRPVSVANKTGGSVTFSGAINANTGPTLPLGIALTTNTGATINFQGGLNLSTGTSTAFSATGGGTVSVCDENPCNPAASGALVNTLTTTTGTALNVANTTIGANRLEFRSISANGAANGIVLNNTGALGGLTVTGTGTAASGGTIQSTTGPGILLSTAAGISLARMVIQNGGDDGIRGTTVTGFTLANSTLQNNGNAIGSGNAGDNGLDFTDLLGTASISSSTITGSFHNNIIIRNTTGTLSGLTVTGATIGNNVSTTDGDGFLFEAGGTANMSVNVSSSTFSAHQGDHFQAAALNSGVLNVIFSGNTLSGGHAAPLGQGITINAATGVPGYLGSVSYDLAGNTINGAISNAIFVGLGTSAATASMIGKIRNNTIGTSGTALSCSTQANGVSVDARGNGTFTSAVTGNVIRQCGDRGILSEAGDGDSVLNLTVTGNTIDQQVGALAREAIQTNHGITSTNVFANVDTNAVCVQLGGAGALANTFSHGLGAPDDFRLRKRFEATVRLPGYAGGTDQSAGSLAQVVAFIQGQNTGSAGEPGSASASGTGGGYTGGAACPLPP